MLPREGHQRGTGAGRGRNGRRAVRAPAACAAYLLMAVLAGCARGPSPGEASTTPEGAPAGWPAGVTVSSPWSAVVAFDGDGAPVVVDTSAPGGQVVARRVADGRVRDIPDPDRPGLVFPLSWGVARGLALFGRVCPEPMLDDPSMLDAPADGGCGIDVHRFSLRLLDLVTETWSEVDLDVPLLDGQELAVWAAAGASVLLRGGHRDDPDRAALFALDLGTGAVSDLGPVPQDASPTWCGAEGVFVGTTLPDPTSAAGAWPTEAVVVRAGKVSTTSIGPDPLLPIGCRDGALVTIEPAGSRLVRVAAHDDGVEATPVPLPAPLDAPVHRRIDVGGQRDVLDGVRRFAAPAHPSPPTAMTTGGIRP